MTPPISSYSSWASRSSDDEPRIEPLRKYSFICEGANTEKWYFETLIDRRKELNLNPLIEIEYLEKTGEDKNVSAPIKMIEMISRRKGAKQDRRVVVFDADHLSRNPGEFEKVLKFAKEKDVILGVTNPNFELYLLLHHKNAWTEIVQPHEKELLQRKKTGAKHSSERLFSEIFKINPKTNPRVGDLVDFLNVAIEEEKNLNQNVEQTLGRLTSVVGKILDEIRTTRR